MRFLSLTEAIIVSLVTHLLLVGFLLLYNAYHPQFKPSSVSIELVTPKTNLAKMSAAEKIKRQQVVEQDKKSVNDEKPPKADLLSQNNQTVKRQTIARNKGEFQNVNKRAAPKVTPKPQSTVTKAKPQLKDLTPQFDALAVKEKQQKEEDSKNLEQPIQAGSDGSRSNDYLKDVDEGLETMLNTREFKYYTYYARIRRQLSQYWEPKVKEKLSNLFHRGRHIASDRDHITKLLIVLNEQGNLIKVQVLGESGIIDLDDAATEAFRAAAPFPNPPKGIIETDGTVKIRWDFVLES